MDRIVMDKHRISLEPREKLIKKGHIQGYVTVSNNIIFSLAIQGAIYLNLKAKRQDQQLSITRRLFAKKDDKNVFTKNYLLILGRGIFL